MSLNGQTGIKLSYENLQRANEPNFMKRFKIYKLIKFI